MLRPFVVKHECYALLWHAQLSNTNVTEAEATFFAIKLINFDLRLAVAPARSLNFCA